MSIAFLALSARKGGSLARILDLQQLTVSIYPFPSRR
jgi:hypothetical protein